MRKSILITGSTDGIGKLTATKLAVAGHRVFLHGRNKTKLDTTIAEVKQASGNDAISGYIADFSDLLAVRKMADAVLEGVEQLDVLINNAGIFNSSVRATSAGIDIRIAVNYYAPYLLTHTILPLLEKRPDARIINLSSAAQAAVSLEALHRDLGLGAQQAYAQSKLALTMWSMHLSQQTQASVIALNPGSLLNTKMVQEAFGRHWSGADKGADIIYDLATSVSYEGVTGKYFDNDLGNPKGDFAQAHTDAYDVTKISKLIESTRAFLADKTIL